MSTISFDEQDCLLEEQIEVEAHRRHASPPGSELSASSEGTHDIVYKRQSLTEQNG